MGFGKVAGASAAGLTVDGCGVEDHSSQACHSREFTSMFMEVEDMISKRFGEIGKLLLVQMGGINDEKNIGGFYIRFSAHSQI